MSGGGRNASRDNSSGNTEDDPWQCTRDGCDRIDRHNVALTIGGEASNHISPGLDFTTRPQTDLTTQTNTATLQAINDYLETPQSRAGFIGRFTYDYDGRYLLELLGRYDGSWQFPPTKRWGFFPSVSAGWRLTAEAWWTEGMRRWVSNL